MSHVSKFFKKKGKKNDEKKKKKESQKGKGRRRRGGKGVREEKKREIERKKIFSLLSKIYGNRTVGFHQRKRQSRSTHRELSMGTKILEFCQTPQGRKFFLLGLFIA